MLLDRLQGMARSVAAATARTWKPVKPNRPVRTGVTDRPTLAATLETLYGLPAEHAACLAGKMELAMNRADAGSRVPENRESHAAQARLVV